MPRTADYSIIHDARDTPIRIIMTRIRRRLLIVVVVVIGRGFVPRAARRRGGAHGLDLILRHVARLFALFRRRRFLLGSLFGRRLGLGSRRLGRRLFVGSRLFLLSGGRRRKIIIAAARRRRIRRGIVIVNRIGLALGTSKRFRFRILRDLLLDLLLDLLGRRDENLAGRTRRRQRSIVVRGRKGGRLFGQSLFRLLVVAYLAARRAGHLEKVYRNNKKGNVRGGQTSLAMYKRANVRLSRLSWILLYRAIQIAINKI